MSYLLLFFLLVLTIPAYAEDCNIQCVNKFVNEDAKVVCLQVCEVKEVLKEMVVELKNQTELLKEK